MRFWKGTCKAVLLPVLLLAGASCDSITELNDGREDTARSVMWGLNWCPECSKRTFTEEESVWLEEAWMQYVSASCMDAFYPGSSGWLYQRIILGQIGIDMDVMNKSEWDYATGYWVPPSLRYQYWGMPIFIAEQIVSDRREVATTMMHEAFHEFGEIDEEIAETAATVCTR